MIEKARDMTTEDRLKRFGLHWHWEDAVQFDVIAADANPARWQKRYDELHKTDIGCAILDDRPVPAFLLYRPPGATRYQMIGGRHRKEACIDLKRDSWPAYVIDEPLDEFLIEALPIYDNVGHGKDYPRAERLELAAHLLQHVDRDPRTIAQAMQLKVSDITRFADLQAAMNRGHDLGISTEMRKLSEAVQIEANKTLPNDNVFKATIETLAFTETHGSAAKGLIKDAQCARSEASALKRLTEIYEKHKAELERRKRGGRRATPTCAQKYRRALRWCETVWPGRVELLEITAHDDEFIADLEQHARNNRARENEVIDRCAEVRAMREKFRTERREADGKGELRAALAVAVDQPPLTFGDLFDQIAPFVPRHEAERLWHQRQQLRRGETPDELIAPHRKIAHAIHRELQRYRLEVFAGERAHGQEWTRATQVRVIPAPCAFCGVLFVASRDTTTCSRSHAARKARNLPLVEDARQQQPGELAMRRIDDGARHPETIAIDAIFDALRRLPDQAARARAMAYAKQLIEAEDDPAGPPQLRAVSAD